VVNRAIGNLRHQLGRMNDAPWYRYTFSETPFAFEAKPAEPAKKNHLHMPPT
jgi:2,5-furandicarboxylate decarboxylase 1